MTQEHPITPPPELVKQWAVYKTGHESPVQLWHNVATEAARWGYQQGMDAELEACVEWIAEQDWTWTSAQLRRARRPKPPSLKQQALALIDGCTDPHGDHLDDAALDTIRRALEQLDD